MKNNKNKQDGGTQGSLSLCFVLKILTRTIHIMKKRETRQNYEKKNMKIAEVNENRKKKDNVAREGQPLSFV